MAKTCGSCSYCCKLPAINLPELVKPLNRWCQHCKPGNGCGIYETRPSVCQEYKCAYMLTNMAENLRPDRLGVIFEPSQEYPNILVMRVPEDKYTSIFQREDITELCKLFCKAGTRIIATDGKRSQLFEADPRVPGKYVILKGHMIEELDATGMRRYRYNGVERSGDLKPIAKYDNPALLRSFRLC